MANGGRVAGGEDSADMTHLVIEDNSVEVTPESLKSPDSPDTLQVLPQQLEQGLREGCHVVKGEWFWRSIQIEAAANVSHHRCPHHL